MAQHARPRGISATRKRRRSAPFVLFTKGEEFRQSSARACDPAKLLRTLCMICSNPARQVCLSAGHEHPRELWIRMAKSRGKPFSHGSWQL